MENDTKVQQKASWIIKTFGLTGNLDSPMAGVLQVIIQAM